MDYRVERLAKLLVHYSLELKKGQLLKIQGEAVALPLIEATFEEAVKAGANPYTQILVPNTDEALLRHGRPEQIGFLNPLYKFEMERIDAYIAIWGSSNTRYLAGTDPKKQALKQRARRPVFTRFFQRVAKKQAKWVGTQYPTLADAQEADLSLKDYEDFVYSAGHITSKDPIARWRQMEKEQMRLKKILDRVDRVHVQSAKSDLKLRVKGRKWISCHGTENFPDGEIFTSPLEDSANGHIHYSFPAVYNGREVEDVRLEFKNGKVVGESAGRNKSYLTAMLDMDKGSRFLGEFAIGTNYEIKRFSKNILFDEKIGGTCHLAVGASIPESGGKNESGLHWDMVCDLRKDSQITADGKVIYRNGKFTI